MAASSDAVMGLTVMDLKWSFIDSPPQADFCIRFFDERVSHPDVLEATTGMTCAVRMWTTAAVFDVPSSSLIER
jgi:hypothetical protein